MGEGGITPKAAVLAAHPAIGAARADIDSWIAAFRTIRQTKRLGVGGQRIRAEPHPSPSRRGDHVQLNDAAYRAMGDAVDLGLFEQSLFGPDRPDVAEGSIHE